MINGLLNCSGKNEQMNAGHLKQRSFSSVINAAPDFAEAWNKRATVYFLMGAYDLSKKDIAQTIAREPQHFGAWSGLGLVETHIGNYDAALKACRRREIYPFLEGYENMVEKLKTGTSTHFKTERRQNVPSRAVYLFNSQKPDFVLD